MRIKLLGAAAVAIGALAASLGVASGAASATVPIAQPADVTCFAINIPLLMPGAPLIICLPFNL